MANLVIALFIVLGLVSSAFTLDLGHVLGMRMGQRSANPDQPRIVEVVRWRQPVCIVPAPGVLPCLVGLKELQEGTRLESSSVTKGDEENEKNLEVRVPSNENSSSENIDESNSEEETVRDEKKTDDTIESTRHLRTKRTIVRSQMPRLVSSRIVRTASFERMHPSRFQRFVHPNEPKYKQGRYLRIASQMPKSDRNENQNENQKERDQQIIYVTKVVDSPVTATLVAHTCLPDIGLPLCDDSYVVHSPQVQKPLINPPKNPWSSGKPDNSGGGLLQGVGSYSNRPNVIQTNENPEVKPVIVVRPTPKPGLLAGLGNWQLTPGSWFNVFGNRPNSQNEEVLVVQNPGHVDSRPPHRPVLVEVPERPTFQEILYKPENDISNNPGLLGIANDPSHHHPGSIGVVAPATQRPGIFGGLFASPSRPVGVYQVSATTQRPSILEGLGNMFNRPASNKPLVIEKPGEKPIVLEKPVYVVEQPATGSILDVFNRPENKPDLDHLPSIKDPVYVLQKPAERPSLFGNGILGNLVNLNGKPTSSKPEAESHHDPTHEKPHLSQGSTGGVAVTIVEPLTQLDPVLIGNQPPFGSYHPVIVSGNPHSSTYSTLTAGYSGIGVVSPSSIGIIGHSATDTKNSESTDSHDASETQDLEGSDSNDHSSASLVKSTDLENTDESLPSEFESVKVNEPKKKIDNET